MRAFKFRIYPTLKQRRQLQLNTRTWNCNTCGTCHDRDIAAAQVILQKATARNAGGKVRKDLTQACGAPQPPETRGFALDDKGRLETGKAQRRPRTGRSRGAGISQSVRALATDSEMLNRFKGETI